MVQFASVRACRWSSRGAAGRRAAETGRREHRVSGNCVVRAANEGGAAVAGKKRGRRQEGLESWRMQSAASLASWVKLATFGR